MHGFEKKNEDDDDGATPRYQWRWVVTGMVISNAKRV